MDLVAQYRGWFQYEKEANAKTLASFDTVPASKRSGTEYQKAVDVFAHLAAARRMWLNRIGFGTRSETSNASWFFGELPARANGIATTSDLFPTGRNLDHVKKDIASVHAAWDRYFETLDEKEIKRTFEYTSSEGGRYRNTVEDVLAQLYGHAWYHRGQIALLVRTAGGTPAETDFVFQTRKRVP